MGKFVKICIVGGGNLAHVCAGVLASQSNCQVNMLTRHPEKWNTQIVAEDLNGKKYTGNLHTVSNNAEDVAPGNDIIFLCLPGFAIEYVLHNIKPYIENATVGSIVCSTGFFFTAHRILGTKAKLFGFQRTPFIARTTEYGHSATLLGYKSKIAIATENIYDTEDFRKTVEKLWLTPTSLLNSHYEASLTNSNPILHTGRLYSMWKEWKGEIYNHNILFYREWTNEASRIIIDMDAEFMKLLEVLPVTRGSIPTLLDYYESSDAESLTQKIRSIPAFQNILSPMKEVHGGWIPDFRNRYFTEDFPYGLRFIQELCKKHHINSPCIDEIYRWGIEKIK